MTHSYFPLFYASCKDAFLNYAYLSRAVLLVGHKSVKCLCTDGLMTHSEYQKTFIMHVSFSLILNDSSVLEKRLGFAKFYLEVLRILLDFNHKTLTE